MAAFMSAASGAVAADEAQQSGWQKFIPTKILQAVSAPSQLSWGQQQSGNKLARFSVKTRVLSELSRSRDGTLTLSFGRKGLNVIKRFYVPLPMPTLILSTSLVSLKAKTSKWLNEYLKEPVSSSNTK
jgi:hypothetical protein